MRELVIPPSSQKPLAVVRAEYMLTTPWQRAHDLRPGTPVLGTERQSILQAPDTTKLGWETILTYSAQRKHIGRVSQDFNFPGWHEFSERLRYATKSRYDESGRLRSVHDHFDKDLPRAQRVLQVIDQVVEVLTV